MIAKSDHWLLKREPFASIILTRFWLWYFSKPKVPSPNTQFQISTLFIFSCLNCLGQSQEIPTLEKKLNEKHYLTKINVSDKKNCFVTLVYKDGRKYSWKVLKKDTLKIIHSTLLDSLCLKCDSIPDLKYKLPPREKNKTLRVPLRGDERVEPF